MNTGGQQQICNWAAGELKFESLHFRIESLLMLPTKKARVGFILAAFKPIKQVAHVAAHEIDAWVYNYAAASIK